MENGLHRGQLLRWNDSRGFGFIHPTKGSQEVFLHISEIKDSNRRPKVGDTIYYYVIHENGKIRAFNAFILGARIKPNDTNSSVIKQYPFPILEAALLSIFPIIGSLHFTWKTANPIPFVLYLAMSVTTFFLYADDKSRAKRGTWRISERTLHLCEFFGGWLGGFIAQRRLNHKSSKVSYQFVFWWIVTSHLGFWMCWLFLNYRNRP